MVEGKFKIYDLSQRFSGDVPTYKTVSPPTIAVIRDYEPFSIKPGTSGWYSSFISMSPHSGTHMDSPAHINECGWTIDKIPLNYLVSEGTVVSIPKGEREEITAEDLRNAKPEIKEEDIVVINTGWHKMWAERNQYEKALYYATNYPSLGKSGAEWLRDRKVKMVMIDSLALDTATNQDSLEFPVHKVLLGANIPGVENVGGQIDEVTGKRCLIIAAPVKYADGEAFPLRVLALVET